MSDETRAIRDGFEEFYRRKWDGHQGLWLDWYPAHLGLYADLLRQRNRAIAAVLPSVVHDALDLGCGAGDVSALLTARAERVFSVDVAQSNALQTTTNLVARGAVARVVKGAAEDLPFAGESFDVVVLADVIEHVPDRARAAAEIARVLRPGGVAILATPDRAVLSAISAVDAVFAHGLRGARAAVRTVLRRTKTPSAEAGAEPWEEFLSRGDLAELVRGAGLTVRRHDNICFYPGPEGGGAFASVLALLGRAPAVRGVVEPALRAVFAQIARVRVLNQKQLIVAEKRAADSGTGR